MKVQGTVAKILLVNGGFIKVKLEDDDNWYSFGKKKPAMAEGDYVSFEYNTSQNGKYTNHDAIVSTVTVTAKSSPTSPPSPKGGDITKEQYWKNKEERDVQRDMIISYAAARNAAIEVAIAALQGGILPTKGNKKQDQFDQFVEIIKQQTEIFFKEVSDIAYIESILSNEDGKKIDSYVADFDDDISF